MFESGVKVLPLLLLLVGLQALLGVFGLGGGGVRINYTHVVNTVCTLSPEVSDKQIPCQILLILQRLLFYIVLPPVQHNLC